MQPCQNCQAVIDEYILDKQLEPLRELTVDDFNLCADCVTIVSDACVECGGAVYVPVPKPVNPTTVRPVGRTGSNRRARTPAGTANRFTAERRAVGSDGPFVSRTLVIEYPS